MKLNIVLSKNAIKIIEEYYEKEDWNS
jgi:hypothetical protein